VGDADPEVRSTRRARAERSREMAGIYSVMVSVMILIVVQFLFLMVALEDFLAGGRSALPGAAVGSGACFAASCWLIRYVSTRRAS